MNEQEHLFDVPCANCNGSGRVLNPDGLWRVCPLCQPQAGREARDQGIKRAHDHANPDFNELAYETGRSLSWKRRDFTSEDILVALEAQGVNTHENRALGAVMRRLARDGYIAKTSEMRESSRAKSHRRPMAVWRSLL